MADTSTIASALAPGVALTSAVIYWANMQGRLDALASKVRTLNSELRTETKGSPRAESVQRQVAALSKRLRVLHMGTVMSVIALVGFLGASAVLFIAMAQFQRGGALATGLFMLGLLSFGASLLTALWEMLWAYRTLEEDVRSSQPRGS